MCPFQRLWWSVQALSIMARAFFGLPHTQDSARQGGDGSWETRGSLRHLLELQRGGPARNPLQITVSKPHFWTHRNLLWMIISNYSKRDKYWNRVAFSNKLHYPSIFYIFRNFSIHWRLIYLFDRKIHVNQFYKIRY